MSTSMIKFLQQKSDCDSFYETVEREKEELKKYPSPETKIDSEKPLEEIKGS